MKAMSRPMKKGKIDKGRRTKLIGAILDGRTVKSRGYRLIFHPSDSHLIPAQRSIVSAKWGRGGWNIFGNASEQELQAATIND